ncbi:hypothetical protein J6590_005231 [Homalodisca vitripennis]|nr:hypothetical protein J6590_005231 [Homalodisca vitripennis]
MKSRLIEKSGRGACQKTIFVRERQSDRSTSSIKEAVDGYTGFPPKSSINHVTQTAATLVLVSHPFGPLFTPPATSHPQALYIAREERWYRRSVTCPSLETRRQRACSVLRMRRQCSLLINRHPPHAPCLVTVPAQRPAPRYRLTFDPARSSVPPP